MSRLCSSEPAMNTWSPQTTGEFVPGLGIGFFQATSPALQARGAFLCGAVASPCGPRNEGHAVAGTGADAAAEGFAPSAGFGAGSAALASAGLASAGLAAGDVSLARASEAAAAGWPSAFSSFIRSK